MDYLEADESSINSSSSNDLSPTHVVISSSTSHVSPGTHKRRAGRKKFRETRHPVYRGVRERNGGKWVCEVREPHKKTRIWLGTYRTPEMAARAHDVASMALRGKSAPLNFTDSAWVLPLSASTSAKDIRAAATEAAEMFRPTTTPMSSPPSQQQQQRRPPASSEGIPERRPSSALFLDEEALFNMPGLIANMAEGMLLTPPATQRGFDWDELDCQVDLSLWG